VNTVMNELHKRDDWYVKNDCIPLNCVCSGECSLECWVVQGGSFQMSGKGWRGGVVS
jgi:hypothetical protein